MPNSLLVSKISIDKSQSSVEPGGAFARKASDAIDRFDLLEKETVLIVGVSGGPDSMVLLHYLKSISAERQIKLVAVHLNHMTRGQESMRDQKFVERWAKRWNIDFVTEELTSPEDKSNSSWEDFWREARWDFFVRTAKQYGSKTVALAHHMNDQAETILLRLLRGTGPSGLVAMRHKSIRSGFRIIRPLLDISRDEITEYAKRNAVRFVDDSSNSLPMFLRNRIRHDLIPYIETNYQEKIQTLLARLASVSAEEDDFLNRATEQAWQESISEEMNGSIVFDANTLSSKHPTIRYRIIRKAAEKLGSIRQIDFAHGEQIQSLFDGKSKKIVGLPKNLEVSRERNRIVVSVEKPPVSSEDSVLYQYEISCGDYRIVDQAKLKILVKGLKGGSGKKKYEKGAGHEWREVVDGDRLAFPLQIRSRRAGDRFHPLGQAKPMKLKDFFIRERVPLYKKSCWPLVVSGNEIVWIPGYRLSESVKIRPGTKNFIELTAEKV